MGALFFSALLWLFVISERTYSYVIEVPIEIRNIKEGKTLKRPVPLSANVRFQATGGAFLKTLLLKPFYDFKLVLDLERISTDYDFYLNDYYEKHSQKVVIPAAFDLKFVEVIWPESVQISMGDYDKKTVRVVPDLNVFPASGFIQVGTIEVTPESIELSGSKEIIRSVDSVHTEVREFLNPDVPIHATIPLNLDFEGVVESSHPDVDVFINIQGIGERIISEVPVKVLNRPEGYRVFPNPSTVSLTVTGGVDFISGLEPSDIEVTIDYRSKQKNQMYYQPTVRVPEDVLEWEDLSPQNIEVAVTKIRE